MQNFAPFVVHPQREISLSTPASYVYTPSIAPYSQSASENWRTVYRTPVYRQSVHRCDRARIAYFCWPCHDRPSRKNTSVFLDQSRFDRFQDLMRLQGRQQASMYTQICSSCCSMESWFRVWD